MRKWAGIKGAHLQLIVVATLYGMNGTCCARPTGVIRTITWENQRRQMAAGLLEVVAAYTELREFSTWWAVKRKVTHLSFFYKNRMLWIAFESST